VTFPFTTALVKGRVDGFALKVGGSAWSVAALPAVPCTQAHLRGRSYTHTSARSMSAVPVLSSMSVSVPAPFPVTPTQAGDATKGGLTTMYDGPRPGGYQPMKKQGAIVLGIGGDNSNRAIGTFYEGVITSGDTTDAADDAVQANIVSVGYGQ
jgi:hypothetical protein